MNALGPILFVLILAALATAGFTGFGVQDTRDTRYSLVPPTAPLVEGRPRISERLRSQRANRGGRSLLAPFAGHHLTR